MKLFCLANGFLSAYVALKFSLARAGDSRVPNNVLKFHAKSKTNFERAEMNFMQSGKKFFRF